MYSHFSIQIIQNILLRMYPITSENVSIKSGRTTQLDNDQAWDNLLNDYF